MPTILLAECKQEVATFNPQLGCYNDFVVRRDDELVGYHRGLRTEMGGALKILEARSDLRLIPTYSAVGITSGGTLSAATWHQLAGEFLESIKAAGPIDGIYFSMHGAMASEDESDPEGFLLAETRRIVGEEIPIVVSLDLHGVLTDRMVAQSDALVAFHTYPHVDFYETGERAARLLLRIMAGEVCPVSAKVAIPALVRGDELITATGLIGEAIRRAQDFEKEPKGLSAALFIGNPFTDVPALQSYSLVVTDNDPAGAKSTALELAQMLWRHHEKMQVPLRSLEEMTEMLRSRQNGTVALVDAADATSSGASGDSNAILRQLMTANFRETLLVPVVDAAAVTQAFAAGVGGKIATRIGGSIDPQRFAPLPLNATVRLLSDGRFRSESFGEAWYAGPTAVLEAQNVTLVVTSRAVNLYDRALFLAHGQDPRRFVAVVVKSPHCERHMYADWCAQMINVDAPGATSANLCRLGHTRCVRPIFPLDGRVPFRPEAVIFQRDRPRTSSHENP